MLGTPVRISFASSKHGFAVSFASRSADIPGLHKSKQRTGQEGEGTDIY